MSCGDIDPNIVKIFNNFSDVEDYAREINSKYGYFDYEIIESKYNSED